MHLTMKNLQRIKLIYTFISMLPINILIENYGHTYTYTPNTIDIKEIWNKNVLFVYKLQSVLAIPTFQNIVFVFIKKKRCLERLNKKQTTLVIYIKSFGVFSIQLKKKNLKISTVKFILFYETRIFCLTMFCK